MTRTQMLSFGFFIIVALTAYACWLIAAQQYWLLPIPISCYPFVCWCLWVLWGKR